MRVKEDFYTVELAGLRRHLPLVQVAPEEMQPLQLKVGYVEPVKVATGLELRDECLFPLCPTSGARPAGDHQAVNGELFIV